MKWFQVRSLGDASIILELSSLMLDDPHSAIAHAAIIYYCHNVLKQQNHEKTSFPTERFNSDIFCPEAFPQCPAVWVAYNQP